MKNRSRWFVVLAALIGLVLGGALGLEDDRIVVVVDTPTTPQTVFDPSDHAAALLYLEENPASRIRFIPSYYDLNADNAKSALMAAKKQGIRFFVTTQPSSTLIASHHLFAQGDGLLINTSATTPRLSGRDDDILRLIPDGIQEQIQIAKYIDTLPGRRLLVLRDTQNDAYTRPAFAHFQEMLLLQGRWDIQLVDVNIGEFKPATLADVMKQPFDALYVLGGDFHPAIGNVVQLFHHIHPEAPIILTPWARSPAIYETAGDALQNLVLLSHLPSRQADARVASYFKRFESRFGHPPSAMALKIQAALELLDQAFAAGHTTPTSVKRYLLTHGTIETSLFPITFDANGDSTMALHPIRNLGQELQAN